jgi:3-methyl-2-oxobutanoate hydroxymethyltransferase
MRTTIADLHNMKRAGRRIAMVTAYDFPSARLAERAGIPMLLVGDSLGMVMQGHGSTLPVTLDDMVRHSAYVSRATDKALVVADLPFLTYVTVHDAVVGARRLVQEGGAQAVKLEGERAVAGTVRRLVELGVPVMGHLGFTPQSAHQIGTRVQAKDVESGRNLLQDALALQEAGAFAVVLELVPAPLAEAISRRLSIPTIGIGAGGGCDGQVQVWHDILGLIEGKAFKHAKRYAEVGKAIEAALCAYLHEVEAGVFPTMAHSAPMSQDMVDAIVRGSAADLACPVVG